MSRDTFNDIVPPQKRSIRNISKSSTQRHSIPQRQGEEVYSQPMPGRGRGNFISRLGIWTVAFIVLLVFLVAFSFLFSGSKVVVVPKQKQVTISGNFSAALEPLEDELTYETMQIEASASEVVPATGREVVEEKASGEITIFNDFNTKSQRLIVNTRFETPEGLIYRIQEPIIVPGQQEGPDGDLVPGKITVRVYADEAGEKYNINLTDFTIPGFKGSPQYNGFFARSKTPMTGGFVGEQLSVEEGALQEVTSRLQDKLTKELKTKAIADRPDNFYLPDDMISFDFSSIEITEESSGKANIQLNGVAHAIIFEKSDFAQYVANNTVAGYDGEDISIVSVEELGFIISPDSLPYVTGETVFDFGLEGSAHLVWLFDAEKLKDDLSGRSKDAVTTVLSGYPGIDRASVVLRPFWKQSFPENPEKITVEISLPE